MFACWRKPKATARTIILGSFSIVTPVPANSSSTPVVTEMKTDSNRHRNAKIPAIDILHENNHKFLLRPPSTQPLRTASCRVIAALAKEVFPAGTMTAVTVFASASSFLVVEGTPIISKRNFSVSVTAPTLKIVVIYRKLLDLVAVHSTCTTLTNMNVAVCSLLMEDARAMGTGFRVLKNVKETAATLYIRQLLLRMMLWFTPSRRKHQCKLTPLHPAKIPTWPSAAWPLMLAPVTSESRVTIMTFPKESVCPLPTPAAVETKIISTHWNNVKVSALNLVLGVLLALVIFSALTDTRTIQVPVQRVDALSLAVMFSARSMQCAKFKFYPTENTSELVHQDWKKPAAARHWRIFLLDHAVNSAAVITIVLAFRSAATMDAVLAV
jgi:hypothetical protein